jgi:predicted P-loop ATPase
MLKEMQRLQALGFAIHWLKPKSKMPMESAWTTGSRKTIDELKRTYKLGMNIGVRLGEVSKLPDGYLAVIDCDVKSKDEKHLKEMNAKLAELFGNIFSGPSVASGRGNGSWHYYILTKEPVSPQRLSQSFDKVEVHMPSVTPSKAELERLTTLKISQGVRLRAAWEISLMGEGQQVVLPPSIHPDSGKPYIWYTPIAHGTIPVIAPPVVKLKKTPSQIDGANALTNFKPVQVELAFENLSPRIVAMIEDGLDCDDRSAGLFSATLAMCRAGMKDDVILSVLTDKKNYLGGAAFEHAKTDDRLRAAKWLSTYTLAKARSETSANKIFENEVIVTELSDEAAAIQATEIENEIPWPSRLEKTKNGQIKITLLNIMRVLENVVGEGEPVFYRDLFSNRDYYGTATPWGAKRKDAITDSDILVMKAWLANNYGFEPPQHLINEAVDIIANKNRVHPIREWLKRLTWDGVPRIDTWLKDYMGAVGPEPYLGEVSRKTLLGLVARVMKPSCQFDQVPVLEGAQGVGKSTVGRILAGDDWYCDTLPDIKDKDSMLNLQGAWIVEISELAALRHASSLESYKAFFTRRIDRIRAPYGKRWQDVPRQCVFFGTTNSDDYLRDKTGNRRFWPVKVHGCKFDELKAVREQLFAEAYSKHVSDPDARLDLRGEALDQAFLEQSHRLADDQSTLMLSKFETFEQEQLEKDPEDRFDLTKFQIADLFNGIGPFSMYASQSQFLHYAGEALRQLGYEKKHTKRGKFWIKNAPEKSIEMW